MRDIVEEVWVVLCHSARTQLAIFFGLGFFIGILLVGDVLVGGLELHGPLEPLTDVIRDRLAHRYDKAAWFALGSFLLLAVRFYRKDRKRLLGL
jgi:hypothetical protein